MLPGKPDFAEIRRRDELLKANMGAISRAPWRFLRNRRLARECRDVLALNEAGGVGGYVRINPPPDSAP
jgi:hypothetical protein